MKRLAPSLGSAWKRACIRPWIESYGLQIRWPSHDDPGIQASVPNVRRSNEENPGKHAGRPAALVAIAHCSLTFGSGRPRGNFDTSHSHSDDGDAIRDADPGGGRRRIP